MGQLVGAGSCLRQRLGAHLSPMGCFPCVRVEEAGCGCSQGKQGLAWEKEVEQEGEGTTNLRAKTGSSTCTGRVPGETGPAGTASEMVRDS